jgi:hypothetical protein
MLKGSRIVFILYFVAFVLPILGVMNCDGWNAGSMAVATCAIDNGLFRSYANLYMAFLFFSSFLVFIPVLIYIVICILLTKFIGRVSGENKHNKAIKWD